MLTKRRHIWVIGLTIGVLVVLFFLLGPKQSAEQRIAEDVAILARDSWHTIHVQSVEFRGPQNSPSDAMVYGARPDGTPVVVQFVEHSPYTSSTAMRRLTEGQLAGRTVEFLLVPRSQVHKSQRGLFDENTTHAGIALFAGVTAAEARHDEVLMPADLEPPDAVSPEEPQQEEAEKHGNG